MPPKGSLAARRKPGCVFFALTLFVAVAGRAEPVDLSGTPRPFWTGTVSLLGRYGASPLRLDGRQLQGAVLAGITLLTLHQADADISRALSMDDARKPWLDATMPTVSMLGEGWAEGGAVALAWGFGDERLSATSAQALQALAIAGVYTAALKAAFWSVRPNGERDDHRYFAYDQGTQSMPSGHSFSAFALAEVYGDEYGRAWTYPFAVLMAYSRLYNQAHWPSDVLAGALLGIAAGYQVRQAAHRDGPPQWHFRIQSGQETRLAFSREF